MRDFLSATDSLKRSGFMVVVHASAFVLPFMVLFIATARLDSAVGQSHVKTGRTTRGSVCGNPLVACKTSVTFDTELFYAVILRTTTVTDDYNCNAFVPETDRLAAQALFPDHKVFTSRCTEAGNLFYTTISENHRIMAVFAGTTLGESNRVLAAVKATGKFPGAYVRRMRTGFNGT